MWRCYDAAMLFSGAKTSLHSRAKLHYPFHSILIYGMSSGDF